MGRGTLLRFSEICTIRETISVVCNEGNAHSFKCPLSAKWQLQVSHKCNTACLFCPEDGSGSFPQNFGTHVRRYIIKSGTARSSLFCRTVSQFLRHAGKCLFIIYRTRRQDCGVVIAVKNSFARKTEGLRDRSIFCGFVFPNLNLWTSCESAQHFVASSGVSK